MIENLRKYTVLIIVLFVLVIISFILMDTNTMQKSRGGVPILKIAERTYTDGDVMKLGSSGYELTQSLYYAGDFQLVAFLTTLQGNAGSNDEAKENFFINRMLLRSAKEEFGVYPGDEEIDSFIRQLRAFTSPDGAFSQEQYRNFIERGLGRLGLIEGDIRELASDILIHRKLMEILGSGLTTDRNIVAKQVAIDGQRINAKLASIDMASIKEKIAPTEDEIKVYWETVQDAFKTEEKRKFTYLVVQSTPKEEPAEIAPLAADANDAAKAEYAIKMTERDAAIAEIKREARLDVGKKVDDFLFKLETQTNLDFKKLAEDLSFELQTTELIVKSEAPEELQAALRSSTMPGNAADALFRLSVTSDPASRIIDLAIGESDWVLAYVDEIEVSRIKTFEEAKEDALNQLSTDQAAAALATAANEANEKIKAAIAEGKTFEEAAKAAGIESEIVSLTEATQNTQLDPTKYPMNFFDTAKFTTPGALTEPVVETDRAFLILVEKREFVVDANTENMIDTEFNRAEESNRISAFISWLSEKSEAAGIQRLNRR
jgi:hypothetical protein